MPAPRFDTMPRPPPIKSYTFDTSNEIPYVSPDGHYQSHADSGRAQRSPITPQGFDFPTPIFTAPPYAPQYYSLTRQEDDVESEFDKFGHGFNYVRHQPQMHAQQGLPHSFTHAHAQGHGQQGFAQYPHPIAIPPPPPMNVPVPVPIPQPNGYTPRSVTEVDPFYVPALVKPSPPTKRGKKTAPKSDAPKQQPTFLTRLYDILRTPEYHHIIRWDASGEILIIERPDELSKKILKLVYKQSRFASFSRQLNIYGFMRKTSLRHVEREINHPDASTWAHEQLNRDSTPEQILAFKRRVPPRPNNGRKPPTQTAQPNGDATRDEPMQDAASPSQSESSESDAYGPLFSGEQRPPRNFGVPGPNCSTPTLPFFWQTSTAMTPTSERPHTSSGTAMTPTQAYEPRGGLAMEHSRSLDGGISPGLIHSRSSSYGMSAGSYFSPVEQAAYPLYQLTQSHQSNISTQGQQHEQSQGPVLGHGQVAAPNASGNITTGWGTHQGVLGEPFRPSGPLNRNGFVDIHTREPTSPPPNSLGSMGARMASFNGPASVPTSFAPLAGMPEWSGHGSASGNQSLPASSPSQSALPTAFSTPGQDNGSLPAVSGGNSLGSPVMQSTTPLVPSPIGIEQALTAASPRRRETIAATAPTSPRQARRNSITSSSPYSPRRSPLNLASLGRVGPIRTTPVVLSMSMSVTGASASTATTTTKAAVEAKSPVNTPPSAPSAEETLPVKVGAVNDEDAEALPSAGLKGMGIGLEPFGNLMKEEEEDDA